MFENIIQKLKTLLVANTLLGAGAVYVYETAESNKSPFATITPSANENDYHSTTENRRVYAFNIRLFVERKGQRDAAQADTAMRELVDSVLDTLDRNYLMAGVTAKAGYTVLFMQAAPSQWAYAGREMEYRVAEIRAQVVVDVDVEVI